jgi:predicted DCC family thiol-disulfide oxidoreductase YuxK
MDPMTVLFDEDCGLCRWSADQLRRWDTVGTLSFAGIRSATGDRLLAGMDMATRLASWHVVASNGAVWSAGAAVPVVARRLRGGAPLGWLAEAFPGTTERVYRWITAHRPEIARLLGEHACAVDPSTAP